MNALMLLHTYSAIPKKRRIVLNQGTCSTVCEKFGFGTHDDKRIYGQAPSHPDRSNRDFSSTYRSILPRLYYLGKLWNQTSHRDSFFYGEETEEAHCPSHFRRLQLDFCIDDHCSEERGRVGAHIFQNCDQTRGVTGMHGD